MTQEISRIEFFCDDKQVGRVQRLLAGLGVRDVRSMPVTNAKVGRNGKVEAAGNGDLVEMFVTWLKQNKLRTVNAPLAKEFMKDSGRSEGSYSNVLRRGMEVGVLKKIKNGKGTTYEVVKRRAK